jgi:hypothetical protein
LNVKPAKIMQQEPVLSELYGHIQTCPRDSANVSETYNYLRACNQMFENGILSKGKIARDRGDVERSIQTGYTYFEQWINDKCRANPNFNPSSTTQQEFLSWQTWDLLRVCKFGFCMLCNDFLTRHPDYYIIPVRINGSAVETLFSQFKFSCAAKLSGVNYA